MLVTVVPRSFDNLSGVRFILLHSCIGEHSYIIMYVELEQGSRLSSSLGSDKVVEGQMLDETAISMQFIAYRQTEGSHMRYHKILFL